MKNEMVKICIELSKGHTAFRRNQVVNKIAKKGICKKTAHKLFFELVEEKTLKMLRSGRYFLKENIDEKIVEMGKESSMAISDEVLIGHIFNVWNEITGQSLKGKNKGQIKLILARLKEGYSLQDFAYVIGLMHNKWKDDPRMSDYIRPETLFTAKFESYLQQRPKEKQGMDKIKSYNFEKYFGGENE